MKKRIRRISEQIIACRDEGMCLVVRGSGTRSWGAASRVVETAELDRWCFFEPDDMVLGVEAGMPISQVIQRAAEAGMVLPIAPFFAGATAGGVVAANDWGPERLERGGVRDWIIGLEYLDDQGRLVKSGGRVVKNVTGYDLAKMMTGSLGGLGIITQVNFKMKPAPIAPHSLFFSMQSIHWLNWFREEVYARKLPLEWVQAVWRKGIWQLGMGISGNEARRQRLVKELQAAFDSQLEVMPDADTPPDASFFAPRHRYHGFLQPHRDRFDAYFDHVHIRVPTGFMLTRDRLMEALTSMPEATLILHPIGADAHLLAPSSYLNMERIDLLRRTMSGSGGYMVLEKVARTVSHSFGHTVPLPGEYILMQRLKQHIDPKGIFASPFYEMV